VKRYEVRWASLGLVEGAEMARTRPAVIVSLSKARLGRKLGTLSSEEARALRRLITEMYGE
jgi:mRNA-degrading endonuclease toxin of MazEF toxin-antitoxin module